MSRARQVVLQSSRLGGPIARASASVCRLTRMEDLGMHVMGRNRPDIRARPMPRYVKSMSTHAPCDIDDVASRAECSE
eukprot:scaffold97649_cov29-Tisochrysis_lutea.AAC.6